MAAEVVLWVVCFWVSVSAEVPGQPLPRLGAEVVGPVVSVSLSDILSWNVQNT